jgi:hypothetical protein
VDEKGILKNPAWIFAVGFHSQVRCSCSPSMMFGPMPLLVIFFAVTMGVNH